MAKKKKVVVKKGTKVVSDVKKSDSQAALKTMAPKKEVSRDPSSVSANRPAANPQAKTVRVKANKSATAKTPESNKVPTAKTPESVKVPTAKTPESVKVPTAKTPESNKVPTANTGALVGQLTTTFAPNPNLSALGTASVGEANEVLDKEMGNIYDQRIGGWGKAQQTKEGKWSESGEEAVKRIVRVKGNKAKIEAVKPEKKKEK